MAPQKNNRRIHLSFALIFAVALGVIIYFAWSYANNAASVERQRIVDVWVLMAAMLLVAVFAFLGSVLSRQAQKKMLESIAKAQETDEYAQLLLDATPQSCTLWDTNLNMINCNKEALKLFDMKTVEEFNDNFFNLSPEFQPNGDNSRQVSCDKIRQAFAEGFLRVGWMHQFLNGDPLPCEVTLVRVKAKEGYLLAGYTRDLREHNAIIDEINKARDAAEAANESKSAFLANMSHEIRTPLNSIIGFSELVIGGEIPHKTRDYLEKINENAKWLLDIINDILDISKIESGKLVLEHIPFSLHDIFAQCQAMIRPKAIEKGLFLHCYAEPALSRTLLGDPVRLKQALINILSNAVKFTHTGSVKLLMSVVSSDDRTATIHFEVNDSGIGISPEKIDKVFQPFVQSDASITRKYGGTGLGLPITKNIIEMMGGKLEVESAPGVGSKFSFDLTFEMSKECLGMPIYKMVLHEQEKPNFQGEVLICEDNSMNQQVICEHLARVGLITVVAGNGKEGVDIVAKREENGEKPFDLIFMDIHMPVMDGLEAASKMTGLGVKTPIVAMTANIMGNDIGLYELSGMQGCLSKPFTSQELWECLSNYFTPVSISVVDKRYQDADDNEFLKQLKLNFVKSNQTKSAEIRKALEDGDVVLAYRLVHILKSNAGQIGETSLQKAAAEVENVLAGGKNLLTKEQITALDDALASSLEGLSPLLSETAAARKDVAISNEEAQELLEQLESMLKKWNPECVDMLGDINAIPGTENLVQLIEEFEFRKATDELSRFMIERVLCDG